MRELFIYYRVAVPGASRALTMAQEMQRRLRERHPGLTARLLRRPDEPRDPTNDQQTWMEIYSFHDANGVSFALQAEVEAEAAALEPFIIGARHTEVFIPCAS
jgi:hypothetical protein